MKISRTLLLVRSTWFSVVAASLAPAGLEQMFFEVGGPLPEGASTASPPTKAEIEKLLATAPSYGIDIRPPSHGFEQ